LFLNEKVIITSDEPAEQEEPHKAAMHIFFGFLPGGVFILQERASNFIDDSDIDKTKAPIKRRK